MNKMTVIQLLNKIANGEEVPKKLKIKKWEYNGENENLKYELFDRLFEEDFELNDEVEIIEDTPKEENKIPENNFNYIYSCEDEHIMANFENIKTTLKDIIDYLKSKGDE